jgi:hypothetical protein
MVKTHVKSWFEVMSGDALTNVRRKQKPFVILQVELSADDEYLVEVVTSEDYKLGYFSNKKEV